MSIQNRVALAVLLLVALGGCERQEAAWDEAKKSDTPSAYQAYLKDYPDGPQAEEARQRIHSMRIAEAWQQAANADSVDAYQQFVTEYPESEEGEQARSRIAEIAGRAAWEALRDSTDMQALQAFAERYAGQPVSEQARQRLTELEAAARTREQERLEAERRADEATRTHRVQLAALRSEQRASDGARALQQQLAEALGETQIETIRAGGFYLLRTEPLSEPDARGLCDRLKAKDQECIVVQR